MSSYLCKFCHNGFYVNDETFKSHSISFESSYVSSFDPEKSAIKISFYKCPLCENVSAEIKGLGKQYKGKTVNFHPYYALVNLPDYIPSAISEDFQEANATLHISPKASATLSRRCLQGMIRDFWNINGKKNLFEEIESIENKVDPMVKQVLHSIRQIANIGAHPEKDTNIIVPIAPGEAEKLLKFVSYLIEEWYVKRYNTEQLMMDINDINNEKQEDRTKS